MKTLRAAAVMTVFAVPALAEDAKDYIAGCTGGSEKDCLRGAQLAQAAGETALLLNFAA
ncbi:MAG: hypothetical protein ACRBCL_10540 [Maritimibacter sp.]